MKRPEKAKLIGEVIKAENTGKYVIDPKKLSVPLVSSESLARVFCLGCGSYQELSFIGVRHQVAVMNLREMPNVIGKYFQVRSCPSCSQSFTGVSLLDIPAGG